MTCPGMLKTLVLVQIDSLPQLSLPHLKRETLPLRSVCSLRGDKRKTFHRIGLLAQLAERGADNAKVVSSSLTWTKIIEHVVFFFNHSRSYLLSQSFDSGDVTLALAAKCRPLLDRKARTNHRLQMLCLVTLNLTASSR